MKNIDLIVFSHLRWEFVTQRPQHIIGRFAKNRRVLFIEEGIPAEGKEGSKIFRPSPSLTVVQPYINGVNTNAEILVRCLNEIISEEKFTSPILWFYSPVFVDMTDSIDHSLVVYDCMDELSAFKGASAEMITQEKKLLAKADVVFTGGKSLFEARKGKHDHIYCFPSSVEAEHFSKSLLPETEIPADVKDISSPIVLYYGVIDERIDLELLRSIANEMPQIAFVMVGPIVKIDPASLPQNANIHYTGLKPYGELPGYLKAASIAMMPFALNDATEYISPTKTLEFFAARKPVISTAIQDVVNDYQFIVRIIHDVTEFEAAIDYYLKEPIGARTNRESIQDTIITNGSWDKTVNEMNQIIMKTLRQKEKLTETVGIP